MVKFNIRSLGMKMLLCLVFFAIAASISAQNYPTRRQGSYPSRPMRSYSSSEANAIARNGDKVYEKNDKNKTNDKDKGKEKKKDKVKSPNEDKSTSLSSDDVELMATGDGSTKQEATLSALRDALEQVYGTMVSSNTQILDDELVKDEIVSISTGVVKKYTYLSEKEVDGKYYVVLKAIVTPQKLVSYVQSKGASTELAGATFAANARMKKLNEENIKKVLRDLTEMQIEIWKHSIDFKIENVSEPKHVGNDNYEVSFFVTGIVNANGTEIIRLEIQKRNIGGQLYTHNLKYIEDMTRIIPPIFTQFKIADDIGEYWLEECKSDQADLKHENYMGFQLKTNLQKGKIKLREDDIVSCIKNVYEEGGFYFNYCFPDNCALTIPFIACYSLEDLDKITGIKVLLR